MSPFAFNEGQILIFFSAMVRVGFLFLMMPIFGEQRVPAVIRLLFSFLISVAIWPIISRAAVGIDLTLFESGLGIATIVMKEALVGLGVGFVSKMFFDALSFAFAQAGAQMGFSMASSFDHTAEASIPVVSHFTMMLATLLFLAIDGHHMLIKSTVQTFEVVPVGGIVIRRDLSTFILSLANDVFWIAIRISGPMALVIFLINCGFGIIAKAVPQINVLMVSFIVNIMAGLAVIVLTMPIFGESISDVFGQMFTQMVEALRYMT